MKKKYLKVCFSLAIGLGLCFWAIVGLSGQEIAQMKDELTRVHCAYPLWAVFLGFLAQISRGIRWQYPLRQMGYEPENKLLIAAVSVGYLFNLTIPRSGEVVRAMALQQAQAIPFERSLGTIITERVIDFCFVLLFIVLAFFFQFELFKRFLLDVISLEKISIALLLFFLLFLLLFYFLFKQNNPLLQRLRDFAKGVKEGLLSVLALPNPWWFVGHTLFIWLAYFAMFYVVFFAIDATSEVAITDALMAFVVGSFAVIFTNGGLGAYPIMVAQVLTFYGIAYPSGLLLGWLIWLSQFAMTLLCGGCSLVILSLYKHQK